MKYILNRGIVKACAGIIESVRTEPYATHIRQAEQVIGAGYSLDDRAQAERAKLIEAVKLNLVNRYEYPYELLVRKYDLHISHATFKRERMKFCYTLALLCGFAAKDEP